MNEVEKMYRNAGVKYYKEICAIKNIIDKVGNKECYFEVCCSSCPLNKTSFTAEKQLNLTKLIGLRYGLKFITNEGMDYMLSTDLYNNDEFDKQGYGYGYDEAIANLINNLWQDLTEAEKAQIKNILESEVRE